MWDLDFILALGEEGDRRYDDARLIEIGRVLVGGRAGRRIFIWSTGRIGAGLEKGSVSIDRHLGRVGHGPVVLSLRELGARTATDFGKQFMEGRFAKLLRTELQDWTIGLSLIAPFHEQRLSFADATSIALLRRLDIAKVAAFDKHFSIVAPEREILSG